MGTAFGVEEWTHGGITSCRKCGVETAAGTRTKCVRLFSGAKHTYLVFEYVYGGSTTTAAVTMDKGGAAYTYSTTVSEG